MELMVKNLAMVAFLAVSIPAIKYYYKKKNVDAFTWAIIADLLAGQTLIWS